MKLNRREISIECDERTEWEESATDDSMYVPNHEMIRNMINSNMQNQVENLFDANENIPFWRQQGIDQAEVHQLMLKEQARYEELKAEAEEEIRKQRAETKAKLKEEAEARIKEEVEKRIKELNK